MLKTSRFTHSTKSSVKLFTCWLVEWSVSHSQFQISTLLVSLDPHEPSDDLEILTPRKCYSSWSKRFKNGQNCPILLRGSHGLSAVGTMDEVKPAGGPSGGPFGGLSALPARISGPAGP